MPDIFTWGFNSGPLVCKATALLTELSPPSPLSPFFLKDNVLLEVGPRGQGTRSGLLVGSSPRGDTEKTRHTRVDPTVSAILGPSIYPRTAGLGLGGINAQRGLPEYSGALLCSPQA